MYELTLLQIHFHPTIQKWAKELGSIDYKGDPLLDFSIQNFLDRISFKNPKGEERVKKAMKVREADISEPVTKRKSQRVDEEYMNWYVERREVKTKVDEDEMSDIA